MKTKRNQLFTLFLLLLSWGTAFSQSSEIQGNVKDEKGDPLIGATIKLSARELVRPSVSLSDTNGKFAIKGLRGNIKYTLTIHYVGFQTKTIADFTIKEGELSSFVVQLEPQNTLSEVVVVGYGTKTRRNVLQSVSTVNARDVVEVPVATLAQNLPGRVPGLIVTQGGGKPGRASSIQVRAYDGFGTAKPPLFVIDGVITDQFAFDGLDASEVENISVLKDGASASAYGVRGANGVIVVTTRKGKTGSPTFNVISSYSVNEPTIQPKTLSAYDEAVFQNDILRAQTPLTYESDSRYYAEDELNYWRDNDNNLLSKYYRKPKEYRVTANVSGGAEKVSYFISGTYYKGSGSFDNINFDKYNIRTNIEAKLTKKLKVSLNLNTDIRNDNKPFWFYDYDSDDMPNLYQGILTRGKMGPDYISQGGVEYPIGTLMKWHPGEVINGNSGYNRKRWSNYQALFDIQYDLHSLLNGLKTRASFASYTRHTFRKALNLPYQLYITDLRGTKNHLVGSDIDFNRTATRNDGNTISENYDAERFYQLNFYLDYDRTFGKHGIMATLMYEQSETNNDYFNAGNQFVLAPSLDQIGLASSDPNHFTVGGSEFDNGRLAGFGRIAYQYDNRYLFEATARYEGSRYFIPSRRYAIFPAVSAGWRISSEPFFKVNFVNDLKLKVAYGLTGEEPNANTLQWAQYYRKANGAYFGAVSNGISLGTYPNENITWAKKKAIDLGLDATLFKNTTTLAITYFATQRSDILGDIGASVPTTWGGTYPLINFGMMRSRGFELSLGYRQTIFDKLGINAQINYSYARNKQLKINEGSNIRPYQSQLNRSTGGIFGYIATDIIRTQAELDALPTGYTINGAQPRLGMLNFRDIRGATSDDPDGIIDANDQEFIANFSAPPSIYGLTVGLQWKNFSIDMLIQGTGNYYGIRQTVNFSQWMSQESGSAEFWKDHWTPENTQATFPLVYAGQGGGLNASTFWLDNRSFIRMKNINIGWTIPGNVSTRAGIKSAKLFLNGSNLFFLKNKTKYYDPEGSFTAYPLNRNITLGLNVSL